MATSALNNASENSVFSDPAGDKVAADGTGEELQDIQLTTLRTIPGVVQLDPWLSPFKDALRSRYSHAQKWIKTINETEGGLEKFSRGYEKYGLIVQPNQDIIYREWAPNATQANVIGDFSQSVSAPGRTTIVNLLSCDRRLEQRRHTDDQGRVWGLGSHLSGERWSACYPSQQQDQGDLNSATYIPLY